MLGDELTPARVRPSTPVPAHGRASRCSRPCRVEDAYTNLVLPALLRQHGLSGRDAAFATELASGTIRWQGTYDAILAACIDRPLSKVESKVLDALRLGTHQLLAMRVPTHAAISTTVDLVALPGRRRVPAGFANAVLRKVSAAGPRGLGRAGRARPGHGRLQPPGLGRRRAARGARAATTSSTRCWPPTTSRPKVTLVARPGRSTARRAARGSRPRSRRTASCWPAATPARSRRSPRAARACRTRAPSWSRSRPAAAPVEGRDDALARPVCRARRQGRAARRAGRRARRRPGRLRAAAAPRRAWCARPARAPTACSGCVAADGTAPPYRPRHLRPGARRRALHRARRAAPPARGPLATAPDRPGRAGRAAAPAARRGAGPDPARRGRALRDLLAGAGRDQRRGHGRPRSAAPTSGSRTSARCCPASPTPPGRCRARVQLWPHRHGTDAMFLALLGAADPTSVGEPHDEPWACGEHRLRGRSGAGSGRGSISGGEAPWQSGPWSRRWAVAARGVQVGLPVLDQLELLPRRTPQAPVADLEDRGARHRREHRGVGRAEHLAAVLDDPPQRRDQAEASRRTTALPRARRGSRSRGSRSGCAAPRGTTRRGSSRGTPGPLAGSVSLVGVQAVHRLGAQEEAPPLATRARAAAAAPRPAGTRSPGWSAGPASSRPRARGRTPPRPPRRSSTCPSRSRRPGR